MSFVCDQCGLAYTFKQSLNRHRKIDHVGTFTPLLKPKPKFMCSVCPNEANESCFEKKDELFHHLQRQHDINVVTEHMEFQSFEAFKTWKSEHQASNATKYNILRGSEADVSSTSSSNSSITRKTVYYRCHRSGYYRPLGNGIRHLKTQGSKKINGYCPSGIKVKIQKDGKCSVEFVSTHVGHKDELAHIFLTRDERSSIASKIAAKVPFNTILDEVRDSFTNPDDSRRIHLLTRKDLHNIETGFNLASESVRHQSDPISIEAWVKQMREGDGGDRILFYKGQDTTDPEHPTLAKSDLMLAIMNDTQVSMLEKFGSDTVCLDGTHELNANNYALITLLVIDDMQQGFPCVFLFTNRTDKDALKIFFTKIKERLGIAATPKVFMSDMAESFYDAWIEVMNVPEKRLYCTWNVDRAWRKNLSKINLEEKRVEGYKMISSLLVERDVETFSLLLKAAETKLEADPTTKDFGIYFKEHYSSKPEPWAYCYRLNVGLNVTMHLESLHKCLKCIYCDGKRVKRLDKAIIALMKFLRDKLFDRTCTNVVSHESNSLNARKEKILMILDEMKHEVLASNSIAELEAIEKLITPFRPTLAAVRASICVREPFKEISSSKKRKIQPQRKFPSTKKKQEPRKNALSKPTAKQQGNIL